MYSFTLRIVFALAACTQAQVQQPLVSGDGDECHNACTALQTSLGEQVYYNSHSLLEGFRDEFYTTQQREAIPACVVTPLSGADVSQAIKTIKQYQCIFAVKSGGHARFAGASNAPGGITIDLKNLNLIAFDEKTQTTEVGPGNRWADVYEVLEPLNKTVVGGRSSIVGVGGFILGGGISFISRRYGWALDNVKNYEVVLANGSLANVNQASAPDLYWALRGGGNNFGVVTKFDLETHNQGQVWGGNRYTLIDPDDISARRAAVGMVPSQFSWSPTSLLHLFGRGVRKAACKLGYCMTVEKFLKIGIDIIMAEQSDPFAQMWLVLAYSREMGSFFAGGMFLYSKPEIEPPVFNGLQQMSKSIISSQKIKNLKEACVDVDSYNIPGYRWEWTTLTFIPSATLLSKIFDIYMEETEKIWDVKDVVPTLVAHPINRDEIRLFSKNGGNCLGFEKDEGPYIIFEVTFRWSRPEDNLKMITAVRNVTERAAALAKDMGLDHRYFYQNYANGSQDVFAGYGEENREKLRKIQDKYDPEGVFSKLQPGYFKV